MKKALPLKKNVALSAEELAVVLDALRRHRKANRIEKPENAFLSIIYDEIEGYIDSAEAKLRKVFEKSLDKQ